MELELPIDHELRRAGDRLNARIQAATGLADDADGSVVGNSEAAAIASGFDLDMDALHIVSTATAMGAVPILASGQAHVLEVVSGALEQGVLLGLMIAELRAAEARR